MDTFIMERNEYRAFTNKIDSMAAQGIMVPHLVEHDKELDTFTVKLLDSDMDSKFLQEKV